MMRCLSTVVCLLFFQLTLLAQTNNEFATEANRYKETKRLKALVDSVVELPVQNGYVAAWKSAGWAMELMLYAHPRFEARLPEIAVTMEQMGADLQWTLLEAWYTLFPGKSAEALVNAWSYARSNKIKALLLQHFNAAKIEFQLSAGDEFLTSPYYQQYLLHQRQPKSLYSIKDIEQIDILQGQSLLVSVQYRDRNKPGFLIIRNHKGNWLKDSHGKLLRFEQLARSITNLPYYLTNGNTPQGLYKITGTAVSENKWIGPTVNMQMVMPFEQSVVSPFFQDTVNATMQYAQLLGRLRSDSSLWQSYYAGRLGRSEIIAHGTTIPPNYYEGKLYYPNTPSLGCLCSPENWDASGTRRQSVQEAWMAKVNTLAVKPNYLLVMEVLD